VARPSPSGRPSSATHSRGELLERLRSETFDIVIVGGGITGAGIARDAAMRGLSVALLEKGDFASGASGRSSRLIHGGLRYLRYRQVRLVREALRERGRLLRLAPHLVRRVPFVLPIFDDGRDSPLVLRLGLAGYDLLAGTLGIGRHRAMSKEALAVEEPQLRKQGLRAGIRYFEAVTDDARLTLAVVLSAVRQGAAALNYVEAVGLEKAGGRVAGVHYRDALGGEEGTVRARAVVSAAGPWTDRVRALAGESGLLRPTKGIHVVVPRARLATNAIVAIGSGDRMLFAVPQGQHTYIGTTDTDYTGEPGEAEANQDDVTYVLDATNAAFEVDLRVSDVVATWAGVRPLLHGEGTPYDVARDYVILDGPPGFFTITGGKLTTFRSMAEHLLDYVIEREGQRFPTQRAACRTASEPLPGGDTSDFVQYEAVAVPKLRQAWDLADDAARRLVERYGTEHARVLACADGRPELLEPLMPGCPVLAVEAVYAARDEMALTLEDFLRRRSGLMLFGDDSCRAVATAAARVMAGALGWSPEEAGRQLTIYHVAVERMFAFRRDAAAGGTAIPGRSVEAGGGLATRSGSDSE
jgi:glycerol-3-phosphate dehydrogenase